MEFKHFSQEDYQPVCDFLIAINQGSRSHMNWNWARWEWMYFHSYFDRSLLDTIGLWMEGSKIVGAAIYDLYHGEAFCGALPGYEGILPEILEYAYKNLRDSNGLGIAVGDEDDAMQVLLERKGFCKAEQTEILLRRSLDESCGYTLPRGFAIRPISLPEDNLAYQTVIWKGFDHEGDIEEWERMISYNGLQHIHRNTDLCLAVVDKSGEFAAHCTCWYDSRTEYAYVEPVCTIPKYRGLGLGKAVVLECLRRCRELGAKEAYVLSDLAFYKGMGFQQFARYSFYWKP